MRGIAAAFVALLSTTAHAQLYGSWTVDRSDDQTSFFAATANGAGGYLGKLCETSGCAWVMTIGASCDDGAIYPALLNGLSGSYPITLRCTPNKTARGRYVINEYQMVEKAVQTGEQLGIAMPLQSGEFRVSRWSIAGWSTASTELAARVKVLMRRPGETNL